MTGAHATDAERSQHLAILKPEYLAKVLDGTKTVECRLTRVKVPPLRCVRPGELVWLKESCGPVRAVAHATQVAYIEDVDAEGLQAIRSAYAPAVAAPGSFWTRRDGCLHCSLITLAGVMRVEPFRLTKRDPRAWVVLRWCDEEAMTTLDQTLFRQLRDRCHPG